MKKLRLIFAFLILTISIIAIGSCTPIEVEPIDPNKTYTVTFDTAGGSLEESQTVKRNDKVTMPDIPTKEGCDFVGWYYGAIAWKFDEYTVRKDMTLTAKWRTSACSVSFSTGVESLDAGAQYAPVYVAYGGVVKSTPKKPVREGFVFSGWYVDGVEWDPTAPVYENILVEAGWNKIHTVTFDCGGVTTVDSQGVEFGKTAKAPDVSDVITHKLIGWYVNGEEWSFNNPVEGDMTVTAVWKRVYWISFNTNGGEKMEPYQVEEGTVISEPEIPYHAGHYFTGWYSLVDEFTLGEHDFSKPVTSNVKLEAKWVVRSSNLVYDDQTLVKIILPDEYRFADGQYITNLKNALDAHLIYDSETVSASSHELVAKYREIVVGRSDREISQKAYARLEQLQKTTDTSLRYLIYVDRVEIARGVQKELSICIAYDEDASGLAMKLAIEDFISSFLCNDTLSLLVGSYNEMVFEPSLLTAPTSASGYAIVSFGKEDA